MLKIGKLAQQAIAAASYLAERYDEMGSRVSAAEIADARSLPRPVVAKVLAQMSLHGLTTGTTGPTGGYRLARVPKAISLFDIVEAFERIDVRPMCPFGPDWCGHGEPHCQSISRLYPQFNYSKVWSSCVYRWLKTCFAIAFPRF